MYRDSGVGKGGYDVGEEIMVRVNDGGKIGRKMMSPERDSWAMMSQKNRKVQTVLRHFSSKQVHCRNP